MAANRENESKKVRTTKTSAFAGVFFLNELLMYNNFMDVLAHTLWTNAGARAGNKLSKKKNGKFNVHVGWTAFWGVFPDFFAFTLPFVIGFYKIIFQGVSLLDIRNHHSVSGGFDLASTLYQYSHSVVIWLIVFILVWIISKRPRYELLGWLLHILIDIPSHSINFYPTPFLFPISDYRFPYGISWSNKWYMLTNYTALFFVWSSILYKKIKRNMIKKEGLKL